MNQEINLICFPPEGGSASFFKPLESKLPPLLKMHAVDYPGRGKRMVEPLLIDMHDLLEDAWRQVSQQMNQPYALYGLGMGGILAYLLAHRAKEENYPPARHLFIAGISSPTSTGNAQLHKLPSRDFTREVFGFDMDKEDESNIFEENKDLYSLFEGILRADFEAIETWKHTARAPLDTPSTIITGEGQGFDESQLQEWQAHVKPACDFVTFPGSIERKINGDYISFGTMPEKYAQLISQKIKE